jgi:hypothetical protein
MNMLLSILSAIALVGIPGIMGSFWVARDLGRSDATGGVLILVFSTVIATLVIYAAPRGNLTGLESLSIATLIVFPISLIVGALNGLNKRKQG